MAVNINDRNILKTVTYHVATGTHGKPAGEGEREGERERERERKRNRVREGEEIGCRIKVRTDAVGREREAAVRREKVGVVSTPDDRHTVTSDSARQLFENILRRKHNSSS